MDGNCLDCGKSDVSGIAWKNANPTVVNDTIVYKKHRYCFTCAVRCGYLSADEARKMEAGAKAIREIRRITGWV